MPRTIPTLTFAQAAILLSQRHLPVKEHALQKEGPRFKSRLCHLWVVSLSQWHLFPGSHYPHLYNGGKNHVSSHSLPCSDERGIENVFCKFLQSEPAQWLTIPGVADSGGHSVLCHLPHTLLLPRFSQPCTITPGASVLLALQASPLPSVVAPLCPESFLDNSRSSPPPTWPGWLLEWDSESLHAWEAAETSTLLQLHNEKENQSMLITLINFLKTKQMKNLRFK